MKIIKEHSDKYGFPFVAMVPDDVGEKPALIFHLHGAGERGNGSEELDRVLLLGMPTMVNDTNLTNGVLIMPQCPLGHFWAGRVESLRAFISEMVRLYDGDTDRLYLCGLSMGGYGTWYTAMAYPDLFAAIAPCCGGGMAWNAGVLRMPVWAFHGLLDTVVTPQQTVEMVEALRKVNPHVRCDLYEDVGHDAWVRAFSPDLLAWMLEQRK